MTTATIAAPVQAVLHEVQQRQRQQKIDNEKAWKKACRDMADGKQVTADVLAAAAERASKSMTDTAKLVQVYGTRAHLQSQLETALAAKAEAAEVFQEMEREKAAFAIVDKAFRTKHRSLYEKNTHLNCLASGIGDIETRLRETFDDAEVLMRESQLSAHALTLSRQIRKLDDELLISSETGNPTTVGSRLADASRKLGNLLRYKKLGMPEQSSLVAARERERQCKAGVEQAKKRRDELQAQLEKVWAEGRAINENKLRG